MDYYKQVLEAIRKQEEDRQRAERVKETCAESEQLNPLSLEK